MVKYVKDKDGFIIEAYQCQICMDTKPRTLEFFHKQGAGLQSYCIECCKLRYVPFDLYQFLPIINCIL